MAELPYFYKRKSKISPLRVCRPPGHNFYFQAAKFFSPQRRGHLFGKDAGQDKTAPGMKIFRGRVSGQSPKMWYAETRWAQGLVLLGAKTLFSNTTRNC
jgi:hypothetical protein